MDVATRLGSLIFDILIATYSVWRSTLLPSCCAYQLPQTVPCLYCCTRGGWNSPPPHHSTWEQAVRPWSGPCDYLDEQFKSAPIECKLLVPGTKEVWNYNRPTLSTYTTFNAHISKKRTVWGGIAMQSHDFLSCSRDRRHRPSRSISLLV